MASDHYSGRLPRLRRAGGILVALALLYFAAGGSFLHQHQSGNETVCHVCQSIHAPALAPIISEIVSTPQVSAWVRTPTESKPALPDFKFLHSGRAPPSA